MALKYSLVLRRDMRKEAQEGDQLYYGQVRVSDRVSFSELCESIASYSTASPGDVKLVIDGLLFVLKQNLHKGNVVEMGDFGNFRMTAGSSGVAMTEDFDTSLFKKGHIVFSPGALLRDICATPKFEKLALAPGSTPTQEGV